MIGERSHRLAALALACFSLALASSCSLYVPDEEVSRADVIVLTAQQPESGYIADGRQSFDLLVEVDAETSTAKDIAITVSDGIVNFAVAPDDTAARSVTVRVAPGGDSAGSTRKTAIVPMVTGRTPGSVFVSAAVEGVQQQISLELAPAPPEVVVLQTSLTAMSLDGAARADLSATLLRDSGQVSLGTRVSWRVCCIGDQQTLITCPTRTPLRVPTLSELQTGDTTTVTAVTERMTAADFGGDGNPFDVMVRAQPVDSSDQTAQCTGAVATTDAMRIQVTPTM